MKKKSIIIALITILCICIGTGAFQAVNGKSEKNITSSVSSASDSSESETAAESITEDNTDETAALSGGSTSKAKAGNETASSGKSGKSTAGSASGNTVQSTDKTARSTASSAAKTSAVRSTTSKRTTTASTKRVTTSKATTTAKKSFKVSITISCKNAVAYGADVPQYMLTTRSITVNRGDTVFDALKSVCKANGISLKYQSIYYVQGIGGLNEKDCGATSGWMYRVNGVAPNKAAANYTLSSGDKIEWYYVTSPSDK